MLRIMVAALENRDKELEGTKPIRYPGCFGLISPQESSDCTTDNTMHLIVSIAMPILE